MALEEREAGPLYMKKILFSLACVLCGSVQAQQDSARIYSLGEVVIEADRRQRDTANAVPIARVEQLERITVSDALNVLPGITRGAVGARNESVVHVRGFDLRRVPVFIDGIPVYVPYDGYVDLARFTTSDLAEVNVSKGSSSVLFGANTFGGAINLVTRKPVQPFELELKGGWLSNGHRAQLNTGGRFGKFYAQLSLSQYERDGFPLSAAYVPTQMEEGGERNNAYNTDNKLNVKVGYEPKAGHEYSVGYVRQHGTKGTPVYAGQDPLNSLFARPRFWQWPRWDKESLYFISRTPIGERSYVKLRAFYDAFGNELRSYDNPRYTTQTAGYAFTSIYDDHTIGGSAEVGTTPNERHFVKLAAHWKQDLHAEYAPGAPRFEMVDNTASFGVEDVISLSRAWRVDVGVNYDLRNSQRADNTDANGNTVAFPANSSDALNGQVGLRYRADSLRTTFFVTVARKTRFATLKDRYSYRLGTAVPNPDLLPENTINSEVGAIINLCERITLRPSLFHSAVNDVILMVNNAVQDPATGFRFAQQRNEGRAQVYGAEFAADVKLCSKLDLGANYTFIRMENLTQPTIRFTDVPEHKVFGYAQWRFRKGSYLVGSVEYNADRYSTSYGTVAPEYTVCNAKVHVGLGRFIAVEVGVNNVLDRDHVVAEGYPEPGRNFFANVVLTPTARK